MSTYARLVSNTDVETYAHNGRGERLVGLGYEKEIKSQGDLHVPFNPSPKNDIGAAKI